MEFWDDVEEARGEAQSLISNIESFISEEWLRSKFHLLMRGLVHATLAHNLASILNDGELSPGSMRQSALAAHPFKPDQVFGRYSVCLFDFEAPGIGVVLRYLHWWRPVLILKEPRLRRMSRRQAIPPEGRAPRPSDVIVLFQLLDPKLIRRIRKRRRRRAGDVEIPHVELRYGKAIPLSVAVELHLLVPGMAWWTVSLEEGRKLCRLSPDELLKEVLMRGAHA
ncbi:MAG: hypothetical protein AAFU73_15660 [Planctomycetota bacterium]